MRTLLLKSLFARAATIAPPTPDSEALAELGQALEKRARRLFGRSITIREVDAGSCNGCELEIHALNNAVYDVERFGIKFAASPRHADVLLVTGPVYAQHEDCVGTNICGDARSEMGGGGGRLRLRLRRVRRELRHGRRQSSRWCRSTCTSRAARRGRSICSKA